LNHQTLVGKRTTDPEARGRVVVARVVVVGRRLVVDATVGVSEVVPEATPPRAPVIAVRIGRIFWSMAAASQPVRPMDVESSNAANRTPETNRWNFMRDLLETEIFGFYHR
jgi:hypothetical protein